MIWTEDLKNGLPAIDAAYQELFHQAEAWLEPGRIKRPLEFLDFFKRQIATLFEHEETIHTVAGYSQAAGHHLVHEKFLASFDGLKKTYLATINPDKTSADIHRHLTTWIRNHILAADKDFAEYYLHDQDLRRRTWRSFQLPRGDNPSLLLPLLLNIPAERKRF